MKELKQIRVLAKEILKLTDSIEGIDTKETNVSKLQSIANSDKANTNKKYPKNREFIENLLDLQKSKNHNTDFLQSILANDYDTVTYGQQKIIVDIANQFNISPDEY